MKPDIRWQLLLAAICLALIFSLLSFQVQSVGLCTTRVPAGGETLAEGMVGLPQRLNPLLADANRIDQELTSLIFDGLTYYDADGRLRPSLARDWQISEDGLTVSFELRDDVTWHDGRSFSAEDVAFTYGLLQQETFPADPALKRLWQLVTIEVSGPNQIAFTLPTAYAPFMDTMGLGILPAHILQNVPPAQLAEHPFNRSPIGTGPFLVTPGSDWQQLGTLRLAVNPLYWRQGVQIETLEFRFYPDSESLADAFASGEIQAISRIDPLSLPALAVLEEMRLFTAPAPRFTQLLFNLSDGRPTADLDLRQALAQALDRPALVDRALQGQGLPLEGPYLPASWAYSAGLLTGYNYRPGEAAALFDAAGWFLPEGQTVRQQDGQLLTLRLLTVDQPEAAAVAAEIQAQWAAAGVAVELELAPATELRPLLAERAFDIAVVDVEPSGDPDLYDFWSQEAIVRGQNYAAWNNRRASEALEAARQLATVDERRPYYDAFLRFFDSDLPALTLYQHVASYGLSTAVNQADIGRIDHPRERYDTLAQWFLSYAEIQVACSEE